MAVGLDRGGRGGDVESVAVPLRGDRRGMMLSADSGRSFVPDGTWPFGAYGPSLERLGCCPSPSRAGVRPLKQAAANMSRLTAEIANSRAATEMSPRWGCGRRTRGNGLRRARAFG